MNDWYLGDQLTFNETQIGVLSLFNLIGIINIKIPVTAYHLLTYKRRT